MTTSLRLLPEAISQSVIVAASSVASSSLPSDFVVGGSAAAGPSVVGGLGVTSTPPALGDDPSSTFLLRSLPVLSSLLTYLTLALSFDTPCGSLSVSPSQLEMRSSLVDGAGLGLFAVEDMEEGTELGTYPGVVREAGGYLRKYREFPDCGSYAW